MSQEMPIVYPGSDTVPTSNHSSNGSYGAVFIVLAVIIILSAFACFLGRLFNKNQNVPKSSEKHAKRNAKDGDIEFGLDKRLATAKVEPTMDRTEPFGEPKMVRPNSFHEPTMSRPNSSFQEPYKVGPNSYREPTMGRPDSFHEPTMGRPSSFDKGESQMRFHAVGDNKLNFIPRTRPQRY